MYAIVVSHPEDGIVAIVSPFFIPEDVELYMELVIGPHANPDLEYDIVENSQSPKMYENSLLRAAGR